MRSYIHTHAHATAVHLLTQGCATAVGNYTSTPAVFAEKIDTLKCNRRWGRPFHPHTNTRVQLLWGDRPSYASSNHRTQKRNSSSEITRNHVPSRTCNSLLEDPPPPYTQTHACHRRWRSCSRSRNKPPCAPGASHSSAPKYCTQATPAKKPPYQTQGDS